MKALKPLTVDYEMIWQCMRDFARATDDYYFDRMTGQVITLSRDVIKSLESEERESEKDLPEWESQMMPIAREIVVEASSKFVRIPEAFGRHEYQWMADFIKVLNSPDARERIHPATKGRGALQRFKEKLKENPEDLQRWTVYCESRWMAHCQEWLNQIGILGVESHPRNARAG